MSFFIRNKGGKSKTPGRGGKKPSIGVKGGQSTHVKEAQRKKRHIEEVLSDEEVPEGDAAKSAGYISSSDGEEETAQEKRIRLAKQYLSHLEVEEQEEEEDEERNRDLISHRLKQDVLEQSGKLHKAVASDYVSPDESAIKLLRGHQLPVTCVVVTPDDKFAFSGSKDCSIFKWSLETCKKVHVIPGGRKGTEKKHKGHTDHVLCMAISSDGRFLASGAKNKEIHIWNPDNCELLHTFSGHRDAVLGLVFRKGSHQMFSCSQDRTVKIWSLDEMSYVETLFGHQDGALAIDSLNRERAITVGGRDGSVRVWKVIEESQLVFHGHGGSIDCVSLINEERFVTGADDGSISMWSVMKKKPLATVRNAHHSTEDAVENLNNWISSIVAMKHTDLVASGSKDGYIRLWKCAGEFKSLAPIFSVPICGFVNSLQFNHGGNMLVAAIGQEHRLGRWWRLPKARNAVALIPLQRKMES